MNATTADARSATVTDQLRRPGDDKMLAGVALYTVAAAWVASRRDRFR